MLNRFKNNSPITNNLDHFFSGFKKGSQPFRRILTSNGCMDSGTGGGVLRRSVNSLSSLIDCQAPSDQRIKSLFCTWNKHFLDSRMRIFKFKYYNNIIGLNSRVAHFNPEINAGCTLCSIVGPRPVAAETLDIYYFPVPQLRKCYTYLKTNFFMILKSKNKHFFGESFQKMKGKIFARQFYLIYFGTKYGNRNWKRKF